MSVYMDIYKRLTTYSTDKEFMDDLFAEYGVANNPKKDKCFQLAWNYGHSAGRHEVLAYFDDLVELIQ